MNDFQRYLAEEFVEDYQEGRISRREALKLVASVVGSLGLAQTFLAACAPLEETAAPEPTSSPPPTSPPTTLSATAEPATEAGGSPDVAATETSPSPTASATPVVSGTVSPGDPAIQAGPVEFPGEDGATLLGYQARPTGEGPFAVVLVCHENRGLTEHIQDVTRRLAKAGYVALAVDLLSRQGGTAAVGSEQVPGVLGNTEPRQFVQDFTSGWQSLQDQPFADTARLGMVGFCFGGGVTWRAATQIAALKAAVPFYGPHPPVEAVPNINAAVLAVYAERDQRINQGIPAIEAAMQTHNKVYEKVIYPDADHAFHNDTISRYNPTAAQDAWARTLAWFGRYL